MTTLVLLATAIILAVASHFVIVARTRKLLRMQFERELQAARDSAARNAYTRVSSAFPQSLAGRTGSDELDSEFSRELSPATIAAIEASISAITGKGVQVRAARQGSAGRVSGGSWAGQGRLTIQQSHEIGYSAAALRPIAPHEVSTSEAA